MTVSWKEGILNFFFPPVCLICRRHLKAANNFFLCDYCRKTFSVAGWVCPICLSTGEKKLHCSCKSAGRNLRKLYSLAWYEGEWRKVIHRFKYYDKPEMAEMLGKMVGSSLLVSGNNFSADIITSVPLHRKKERERGYNQASLLARRIGKEINIPFDNLLSRIRDTVSQTSLSGKERKQNVHGAFAFKGSTDVEGKRILLVDDVYTTGATMKEAGRILIDSGAREVSGAVAAIQGI